MLTENMNETIMREAVWTSGYLLERRVAILLGKAGYKVVTNRVFRDRETIKSREYDVYAYKEIPVYETGPYGIYPTLICQCKNNSKPIVFFVQEKETFNPSSDEVKVSGIPSKIWKRNKYISVQEFMGVESFHHYCVPEAPVSTQCCTFERKNDKSPWEANYGDKLYNTFDSTVKALEYEIDEDFKYMAQWFVAEEMENEFIDLSFYYPVVIYQGDIYAAYVKKDALIDKDSLTFEKCEHVQFNPYFFSSYDNEITSYHVDVIHEKYLSSYLKIIDREILVIKEILEQQKDKVLLSIDRIVSDCKSLKNKPDTYRKHLEYNFYS
jgi:hypothetical protein